MPERDLASRADALAGTIADQSRRISVLSTSINDLAENQARIKKIVWATVAGLILDFVLTITAAFLLNSQRVTNQRLIEANDRIAAIQIRTSDRVLCPLYKTFIAFESRAKDSPQFTPEERAQRIKAYEVIHQGYDTLGCQ